MDRPAAPGGRCPPSGGRQRRRGNPHPAAAAASIRAAGAQRVGPRGVQPPGRRLRVRVGGIRGRQLPQRGRRGSHICGSSRRSTPPRAVCRGLSRGPRDGHGGVLPVELTRHRRVSPRRVKVAQLCLRTAGHCQEPAGGQPAAFSADAAAGRHGAAGCKRSVSRGPAGCCAQAEPLAAGQLSRLGKAASRVRAHHLVPDHCGGRRRRQVSGGNVSAAAAARSKDRAARIAVYGGAAGLAVCGARHGGAAGVAIRTGCGGCTAGDIYPGPARIAV